MAEKNGSKVVVITGASSGIGAALAEHVGTRGASVVLVDRKGDLARYASEAWWNDTSAAQPDRERKLAESAIPARLRDPKEG